MASKMTLAGKERSVRKAGPKDLLKAERDAKASAKDKSEISIFAVINLVKNVITPPLSNEEFENLTIHEINEVLLKSTPAARSTPFPREYEDWTVKDIQEMSGS